MAEKKYMNLSHAHAPVHSTHYLQMVLLESPKPCLDMDDFAHHNNLRTDNVVNGGTMWTALFKCMEMWNCVPPLFLQDLQMAVSIGQPFAVRSEPGSSAFLQNENHYIYHNLYIDMRKTQIHIIF
ncbi:unnamed protein product [Colias eurytheme]|nr:unnamed protein product [Colias eurytheme]